MNLDTVGIESLKRLEGFKNKQYLDSRGLPTIGVGHRLTHSELVSGKIALKDGPVKYRNGLTDSQVDELLYLDSSLAAGYVSLYTNVKLNQNQFNALVCFTFNCGCTAYLHSTLLKLLNKGQYDQVPAQLKRWVHDGSGNEVPGLVNRRNAEINIWFLPVN